MALSIPVAMMASAGLGVGGSIAGAAAGSAANRRTNDANIAIANATNQTNKEIADSVNQLNYQMFQEQNEWNLQQWNRENAYNDPSAQMERLIKAGINPNTALGNVSNGNAQQLTSASPAAAVGADMVTPQLRAFDSAPYVSNLVAATRDILNNSLGFQRLDIERFNADTSRGQLEQKKQMDKYDAAYKKSLVTAQDLQNAYNTDTYSDRVSIQAQSLKNMQQQYENLKQEGKNDAALYENIQSTHELILSETENIKSNISYRIKSLALQSRQLQLNQESQQLDVQRFELEQQKYQSELKKMNNDEIFRWASRFASSSRAKGYVDAGASFNGVGLKAGGEYEGSDVTPNLSALEAANVQMFDNVSKNPTPQNIQALQKYADFIRALESREAEIKSSPWNSSNSSVVNPSSPWQ